MRLVSFFAAALVLSGAGCNKSSTGETSSTAESSAPDASAAAPASDETLTIAEAAPVKTGIAAATPPVPSPLRKPYRLLGILDPDRDRMVAFALKIPAEWRAQQEFHRQWEGAVGLPQISITLNA